MPVLAVISGWRFPVEHALLCDLEQVTAVLGQEVERVGDVGDVFDIAVVEVLAVQGSEQVAGGSDALEGGFEDVLGVGFGVDDQGWGVGEVGVEREVAFVGEWIPFFHFMYSQMHRINRCHRDQAMEADCVRVGQPEEHIRPARPKASQTQPP